MGATVLESSDETDEGKSGKTTKRFNFMLCV